MLPNPRAEVIYARNELQRTLSLRQPKPCFSKLSIVVPFLIPELRRQLELHEFKASVVYRVSFRTTRATQ